MPLIFQAPYGPFSLPKLGRARWHSAVHRDIGFGLSKNQSGSNLAHRGCGGRNGLFVLLFGVMQRPRPIWRDGFGPGIRVATASFGAGIRVFYSDALFKNGAWVLSHGGADTDAQRG